MRPGPSDARAPRAWRLPDHGSKRGARGERSRGHPVSHFRPGHRGRLGLHTLGRLPGQRTHRLTRSGDGDCAPESGSETRIVAPGSPAIWVERFVPSCSLVW